MPIDLQVHLLRVLQENEFTRLGSSKNIKIDVKVIAATNRNLEAMIEERKVQKRLVFQAKCDLYSRSPRYRERKKTSCQSADYYLPLFSTKVS